MTHLFWSHVYFSRFVFFTVQDVISRTWEFWWKSTLFLLMSASASWNGVERRPAAVRLRTACRYPSLFENRCICSVFLHQCVGLCVRWGSDATTVMEESWEVMDGHGRSWKVMDESWKVMEGHGQSWKVPDLGFYLQKILVHRARFRRWTLQIYYWKK